MQNVVRFQIISTLIFSLFVYVSCNETITGDYRFPEIYDVTVDKTTVSVGDEMTVSFHITKGDIKDFEVWAYLSIDQDSNTLIYKGNITDREKNLVYFIVGIDKNDMKQITKDGHVQYMIPYPYGNSEYREKDITQATEYTYYHFDNKTRTVTLGFIVPNGAKTSYLKIDYTADYGLGFYPYEITILDTTND